MMIFMNEQEARTMRIMEHCVLNAEFCDGCENRDSNYDGCCETHELFFKMAKDAFAMRDALLTDLNLACGGKFVDICCVCGHYRPDREGELKCELNGLICSWVWRGIREGCKQ